MALFLNMAKKYISINQPTFMPWLGYFDLIDMSENFVFLDDAQFSKHSWHQRNKVVGGNNNWITLPIGKGNSSRNLNEVDIALDQKAHNKVINKLFSCYNKTPFFDEYFPVFQEILFRAQEEKQKLASINMAIIEVFLKAFKIKTKTHRSSEITAADNRSEKLISIISAFGNSTYLSPPGSKNYLVEDKKLFDDYRISIELHQYHPQKYFDKDWSPYLSAIDLLFRQGPNSRDVVLAGRRQAIKLSSGCVCG